MDVSTLLAPLGVGALAFSAVGLLAYAAAGVFARESGALPQVSLYDQLHHAAETGTVSGVENPVVDRLVDVVGGVARRRGLDVAVQTELERAGLPLRTPEYMLIHVLAVLAVGLLAQAVGHRLPVTLAVIAVASLAPLAGLEMLVQRRKRAFAEQLPQVLDLVAGSLRAGYGLLQAIALVTQEMPEPSAGEFRRVQVEARLGSSVEAALDKMAERVDNEDFRWTVTAVAVQREVGGNLAEVLAIVAATIRERQGLRRQIQSLTAEGRLSAVILTVLPFIEGGILLLVNPGYVATLVGSPLGMSALAAGFVLLAVGAVWLARIVRIEV